MNHGTNTNRGGNRRRGKIERASKYKTLKNEGREATSKYACTGCRSAHSGPRKKINANTSRKADHDLQGGLGRGGTKAEWWYCLGILPGMPGSRVAEEHE